MYFCNLICFTTFLNYTAFIVHMSPSFVDLSLKIYDSIDAMIVYISSVSWEKASLHVFVFNISVLSCIFIILTVLLLLHCTTPSVLTLLRKTFCYQIDAKSKLLAAAFYVSAVDWTNSFSVLESWEGQKQLWPLNDIY